MGLGSTSYRLLQWTDRNHTISLELGKLSNQKLSLTNEMSKLSSDYQDALSTKTLKWSNNAGVSYIDLSYSNLMTPSAMNQQQPYLLTDSSGKVVIASNYRKYAEMISPDGSPGGDWESNRSKILEELTGIDSSKMDSYAKYQADLDAAQTNLDQLNDYKDNTLDRLKEKCAGKNGTLGLLEKLGSTVGAGSFSSESNWKDAYNKKDTITVSNGSDLQAIADQLKKLAPYFPDIETEDFETGIDNAVKGSITSMNNGTELSEGAMVSGKSGEYKVDVVALVNYALKCAGATVSEGNGYTDEQKINYDWVDTSSTEYTTWKTAYDDWEEDYNAAMDAYNQAETSLAGVFTADQESQIAFYDAIFTAIAEKGWTYNNNITDTDYLNQMLQNGAYSLTTMTKSVYTDGQNDDGTAIYNYEYSTDIAENNTHVYKVNDQDTQNQALADYEYKKSIISQKESRIDTRMQNLQTEQAAIQQMIQGLETVRNDNIERTMDVNG